MIIIGKLIRILFFFPAAQQVLVVVWIRNLKYCAKFVVTKPAVNIMEWHHVTDAEDFSKGALGDLQLCKYREAPKRWKHRDFQHKNTGRHLKC